MLHRIPLCLLVLAAALASVGCVMHKPHNLPPAMRLHEPGPGVGGPGPGVLPPMYPAGVPLAPPPPVQVLFARPEAMQVQWDVGGTGAFDSDPLIVPGRSNFPQGGIYRLKLTSIPGRVGVELYPTIEIGPTTPRTGAYLAHNAIPVQFTDEDFDQVLTGNFVTKVIYLPDPEFQELALAGVETLVSTRLDPGIDPITEADRRGAILAIVRLGNKDMEMPGVEGGVQQVGFNSAISGQPDYCPPGMAGSMPIGSGVTPNYVSGITAPQYGMTMSGTPIGLPGPPHIPLGGPAGLQKHVMKNHTHMHLPRPTEKVAVHVKQRPGMSYPKPVSKVFIRETMNHPPLNYHQPYHNRFQMLPSQGAPGPADEYCPE